MYDFGERFVGKGIWDLVGVGFMGGWILFDGGFFWLINEVFNLGFFMLGGKGLFLLWLLVEKGFL